jgi:hypothetical protein
MPAKRSHDRAEDQTQISISLPKWLLDEVNRLAKADRRKRSNWIVRQLEQRIAELEARDKVTRFEPTVRAAEESPPYTAPPKKGQGARSR